MIRTLPVIASVLPKRSPRAVLCALLAAAVLSSPVPAFAQLRASDAVGGVPLSARAFPQSAAPDVDAAAGILVTSDGRVVWAREATSRRPMASTTKMMTALLAIEHGKLDEQVTISHDAAATQDGVGLVAGERLSVRQLLQLALVASANDAAYALGEHTGGSMPAFVKMMNDRARQLGMKDTHYVNPHGLDAPEHYSSAADLATLARTAMSHREFRAFVAMRSVTFPAGPGRGAAVLKPTDELLGSYWGLEGVKTGFTGDAGYCFVGEATRRKLTLISVVLGTESNAARFAQTARLLDWGFSHVARSTVVRAGEEVGRVSISGDPQKSVGVKASDRGVVPALTVGPHLSCEIVLPKRVALPVYAGQTLGEVRIKQGGQLLATVPAVAVSAVSSVNETVASVPVADYLDESVAAKTLDATSVAPFDPRRGVDRHVSVEQRVDAPVKSGQRLGEVVYSQAGHIVARVPVVAASDVVAPRLADLFGITVIRIWRRLVGGPETAALQIIGASPRASSAAR